MKGYECNSECIAFLGLWLEGEGQESRDVLCLMEGACVLIHWMHSVNYFLSRFQLIISLCLWLIK
jgi:hypothetical protein